MQEDKERKKECKVSQFVSRIPRPNRKCAPQFGAVIFKKPFFFFSAGAAGNLQQGIVIMSDSVHLISQGEFTAFLFQFEHQLGESHFCD